MKKTVSLLLAVCLLGALLTGCTTDEKTLWNAYLKTAEYKSCAQDMALQVSVDTSNITDPDMLMGLNSINNMAVNVKGKAINDSKNGVLKADFTASADFMGLSFDYKIWADMDMSNKEQPKFMVIYEFPEFMTAFNSQLKAQYYYVDMSEMLADSGLDLSVANPFDTAKLLESMSEMDTTGMKVEKKDDFYNVLIKNDAFYSIIKQYLNIIFANPAFSALYPEDAITQINESIDKISSDKLFGDKDISSTLSINKDGYIGDFNTAFDFVIDPDDFDIPTAASGKFTVGLDMKAKYTDYNTITSIELPALTSENSANLMDLMDLNSNEIKVLVNGNKVAFDVPPQTVNDRTMVPMRAIFEALGATVEYDEATETITSHAGDKDIIHRIGDKIIYVNEEALEMDVASFETDGRTLVPARFISEALGAKVDWVEEIKTVVITQN